MRGELFESGGMNDRETILECVKATARIGVLPPRSPHTSVEFDTDSLWARFEQALSELGGRLTNAASLSDLGGRTVWVDDDAKRFLPTGIAVAPDVWSADIGIGTAVVAIAETGTLLLSCGPGQARLTSLAPPHHIAIVRKADICATLEDGLERLGTRSSVLATGPSRTADIEGVLVRGVHGPRDVTVIVVP